VADATTLSSLRAQLDSAGAISPGGKGRLVLTGPGLGLIADAHGVESALAPIFARQGLEVVDAEGQGFTTAIIHWQVAASATAVPTTNIQVGALLLIAGVFVAIIAALLAFGWIVTRLRLFVVEALPVAAGSIIAVVAAVAVLILVARKSEAT
tara:strand:- start:2272 stop:2730 length:459 start_codon:yes stop_codon:yes gene_type:complete